MIITQTTVNKPIDICWKTWSEPAHIMNWAFASPDWHAPAATNDLRTGGTFSTTMAAKDGSFSFEFGGTYTEVMEYKVIKYTMGDGRKAEISFEADGNATNIIQKFDPETENPEDMQRAGWQAILDNYTKYTEGL